jgi:hypothetical protein
VLDDSISLWINKQWTNLTSYTGLNIWSDGTNIYYSNGNNQYVLKSNNAWAVKGGGGDPIAKLYQLITS